MLLPALPPPSDGDDVLTYCKCRGEKYNEPARDWIGDDPQAAIGIREQRILVDLALQTDMCAADAFEPH